MFRDSFKRRRNANGKNIYEYAIYKCERGHTWNKMLDVYKAADRRPDAVETADEAGSGFNAPDLLSLSFCRERGIEAVEIRIETAGGKPRLDKLLSRQIADLSRARINAWITCGRILVNDQRVKPAHTVCEGEIIRITL